MAINHKLSTAAVVERWASRSGKAVIFDFNGTLSDDEPTLLCVFSAMFQDHFGWTLQPDDYFSRLAGRSDREIVETVVNEQRGGDRALVDKLLTERRDRYFDLVARETPIRDETMKMIEILVSAQIPLGIVTGAQRPDVEYVLAGRGIASIFRSVVTEEDVNRGKPDPEGYLNTLRLLGFPKGALVLEDTEAGISSAKAAGLRVIAKLGTLDPQRLREADELVDRIDVELMRRCLS